LEHFASHSLDVVREKMMKPNIKLLLVALLFVVVAIGVSLGVATHTEGETARFALWAFFAIILSSSIFVFVMTAMVIVRAMRGRFGISKFASSTSPDDPPGSLSVVKEKST